MLCLLLGHHQFHLQPLCHKQVVALQFHPHNPSTNQHPITGQWCCVRGLELLVHPHKMRRHRDSVELVVLYLSHLNGAGLIQRHG
jgi:hypothetical protein